MDSNMNLLKSLKNRRTLVAWILLGFISLAPFFVYIYRELVLKPVIDQKLSTRENSLLSLSRFSKQLKTNTSTKTPFNAKNDKFAKNKSNFLTAVDQKIKLEMQDYNFTGIANPPLLKSLQIKHGGDPVKSVIFATWRSGSTFLGELVSSHPFTFHHYEPLLHMRQVRASGANQTRGLKIIEKLLTCNYSDVPEITKCDPWMTEEQNRRNPLLWNICQGARNMCMDHDFIGEMCKLFPFLSLKTVRMPLVTGRTLLENSNLKNLRLLLLVRDPRAIMHSRKRESWCNEGKDCSDPTVLCQDMAEDWIQAKILRNLYPNRFMAMRYEDVSLNPLRATKKIFKFFNLQVKPDVRYFLQTHTITAYGAPTNTYKDSSKTPFRWVQEQFGGGNNQSIKENEVKNAVLESICSDALRHWGYARLPRKLVPNWNPLRRPPWPDMAI